MTTILTSKMKPTALGKSSRIVPNNKKLLASLVSIALLQMSGQIGNVWAQSTPTPASVEPAKTAAEEKDKNSLALDTIVVTGTPQGV